MDKFIWSWKGVLQRFSWFSSYANVTNAIFIFLKLPYTIPELVKVSPCRSSDGILYAGKTIFFQIKINKKFRKQEGCVDLHWPGIWWKKDWQVTLNFRYK